MGRTFLVRRHLRNSRHDLNDGRSCNAYSAPTSGLAAGAQAIRYHLRGAALGANISSVGTLCMCVFVFCDRREVRGRHAAVVKLVFFFFCYLINLNIKSSNQFTGLVGAARGEVRGCAVLQSSCTCTRTWTRFPESRTLLRTCILHFRFVRSSLPTFSPPVSSSPPHPTPPLIFRPSNEQSHVLILLTRSRPHTHTPFNDDSSLALFPPAFLYTTPTRAHSSHHL
jgi:hypothetical protein